MPKATVSKSRAERVLAALAQQEPVDSVEQWTVLRALPPGLDGELVFRAFEKCLTRPHEAYSLGTGLRPQYLEFYREILSRTPTWPEAIAASHLSAETAEGKVEQLRSVLTQFQQLGVFSQSMSQTEARVRVSAADPVFVEFARTMVAGGFFPEGREFHRWALMSVLLEEGSRESVDVLLPFIHRAMEEGGQQLDGWRALLRRKKSLKADVRPLRELLESQAASRRGPLQKARIAQAIGLPSTPSRLAWKWCANAEFNQGWVAHLHVDCDAEPWFKAGLTDRERSTTVDSNGIVHDELKLGPLKDALDFPAWFAAATKTFGITWPGPGEGYADQLYWSTLRGKGRRLVSLWHWSAGSV